MCVQTLIESEYATVSDKTWHMGFFVKVEFYVWLKSSTIELTRVQVSDRLCALLWRYSALFVIAPHPDSPKALLCTHIMAFPHTTRDPEIN